MLRDAFAVTASDEMDQDLSMGERTRSRSSKKRQRDNIMGSTSVADKPMSGRHCFHEGDCEPEKRPRSRADTDLSCIFFSGASTPSINHNHLWAPSPSDGSTDDEDERLSSIMLALIRLQPIITAPYRAIARLDHFVVSAFICIQRAGVPTSTLVKWPLLTVLATVNLLEMFASQYDQLRTAGSRWRQEATGRVTSKTRARTPPDLPELTIKSFAADVLGLLYKDVTAVSMHLLHEMDWRMVIEPEEADAKLAGWANARPGSPARDLSNWIRAQHDSGRTPLLELAPAAASPLRLLPESTRSDRESSPPPLPAAPLFRWSGAAARLPPDVVPSSRLAGLGGRGAAAAYNPLDSISSAAPKPRGPLFACNSSPSTGGDDCWTFGVKLFDLGLTEKSAPASAAFGLGNTFALDFFSPGVASVYTPAYDSSNDVA